MRFGQAVVVQLTNLVPLPSPLPTPPSSSDRVLISSWRSFKSFIFPRIYRNWGRTNDCIKISTTKIKCRSRKRRRRRRRRRKEGLICGFVAQGTRLDIGADLIRFGASMPMRRSWQRPQQSSFSRICNCATVAAPLPAEPTDAHNHRKKRGKNSKASVSRHPATRNLHRASA